MLTRRIIQQLTDSVLLDISLPSTCFCAHQKRRVAVALPRPSPSQANHFDIHHRRHASTSSSSTRWKSRQTRDRFAREAKVTGLKSRAAFKLLEIDARYRLFRPGQTVVDLGYAPGSWSQVAQTKTSPGGRVVGIDVLPVQPPKGVSTIQGNFLSEAVRDEVRRYVLDPERGRLRTGLGSVGEQVQEEEDGGDEGQHLTEHERGYVDMERHANLDVRLETRPQVDPVESDDVGGGDHNPPTPAKRVRTLSQRDAAHGRVVDVLLSDMSAPWPQATNPWINSVSNVYRRMQNTSGIPFRDHAGSMDLCGAALGFAFDTLRAGGAFVCKFYAGAEDRLLERRLKALFEKVVREKPESSRSESKEAYFIGIRRKENAIREEVMG